MPMDRAKYPPNWDEIALRVKNAADWHCEKCGIGHMSDGTFGSCLTVHHPNLDPENPDAEMIALCARCHLRADARIRKYGIIADQLTLEGFTSNLKP